MFETKLQNAGTFCLSQFHFAPQLQISQPRNKNHKFSGNLFYSKTVVWTLETSDYKITFSEPSKCVFAMAIFEICMMLGCYAKKIHRNRKYPTMRLAIRHHSLYLRCHQHPVRPDCCSFFGGFIWTEVRIKLAAPGGPSLMFHFLIVFHHRFIIVLSCLVLSCPVLLRQMQDRA